jgi:hypothetical protein
MTARTRLIVFLVSTPLLALVTVGGIMGGARRPAPRSARCRTSPSGRRALSDRERVRRKVDVDKVMDGAMRGLVEGLDPSSAYLTPDEVTAMETTSVAARGDVGIVVTRQFYLRVVGVRDGLAGRESWACRPATSSGDRQLRDPRHVRLHRQRCCAARRAPRSPS